LGCDVRKHFGILKGGKSVTLDDGRVITPDMVLSPSDPAESFMIVFLPHESYINSFIADNQNLFKMVQEEKSKNFRTSVIYHSMPVSVIRNPIYRQEFMLKFGEHVQHILDCPET
jgi:hypothetical protein